MPVQARELLQLQELDSRIDALARARAALDNGDTLKAALDAAETALNDARARLHQAEAEQVAAELEQKTIEEKKGTVSRKLYEGKVTNPKELAAMEQEIEMFGRQRGRLDERILLLMDQIETGTAEVEQLTAEHAAAREAYEQHMAAHKRELSRINGELKQLLPQRGPAAEALEKATLQKYEDLRRRSGNLAAVRLDEGRCGGCHTSIPGMMARDVEAGTRYTYCENCNRFLFPAA